MAITFNKKSWKSRISEHPTRRRLTIVDASLGYSLVDVAREEGTVEQVGDTFDKSTMDDLENRIEAGFTSAQDSVDDLQEQIDEMPSLNDVKEVDVGWKESGTRNVAGDTIRVNPFELFSGTVGAQSVPPVEGSTTQQGTPTPSNPVDIVGVGVKQQDGTYSVTVGNVTASGLAYPLYEGDILDFANGKVIRANGYIDLGSLDWAFIEASANFPYGYFWTSVSGKALGLTNVKSPIYIAYNSLYLRDNAIMGSTSNDRIFIVDSRYNDAVAFKTAVSNVYVVYALATPTEEYITITGVNKVINGFIPSAKFFQMGRAFMQEKPVKEFREELNPYYEGALLNVTKDRFYSLEYVDINRVSDVQTMYGYDYTNERFLTSVAGEIYTASGSISCDLQVTDIWGCGGNGASYYHSDTTVPVDLTNRNTTSANGFPIELMPVNQSDVASLVVGSPVSFRITGELYILLHNGVSLREYTEGMQVSKFYNFVPWTDTRDGVHYAKHFIDIEKGTTFNLSSITTLINYHFLQAYVDDPDMLDYISWTVTDSNIAITGDDYATGIVLHIDQRKDGETEPDLDTAEDIIINVI